MYDKKLVVVILSQIETALQTINQRAARYKSAEDFTSSAAGIESLDTSDVKLEID